MKNKLGLAHYNGLTLQEAFERNFPSFAGQVAFTIHANDRFSERFSRYNQQLGRAVLKAIRQLKKRPHQRYATGSTYQADIVVSRDSNDGKFVVITTWNKETE